MFLLWICIEVNHMNTYDAYVGIYSVLYVLDVTKLHVPNTSILLP